MKIAVYLLTALVFVVVSAWLTDKTQYKRQIAEKNESIRLLQEKLSKCQSNVVVFDGKVKKSDLNVKQLLKTNDTCQVDTADIVAWWEGLKPRERRKYRREQQ